VFHGRESDEAIDDSGAVPTPSGGCEVYVRSSQGIYVLSPMDSWLHSSPKTREHWFRSASTAKYQLVQEHTHA
jgi:hypothetical protein